MSPERIVPRPNVGKGLPTTQDRVGAAPARSTAPQEARASRQLSSCPAADPRAVPDAVRAAGLLHTHDTRPRDPDRPIVGRRDEEGFGADLREGGVPLDTVREDRGDEGPAGDVPNPTPFKDPVPGIRLGR